MADTFNIAWSGPSDLDLHKPYPQGENGQDSYQIQNFSFRSGNYASYIDGISDIGIDLTGYENDDAINKFESLHYLMDQGIELTITGLNDVDDGVYILVSFSYTPIGLDVFEYRMQLKFVTELR
jgi:hypothetical protein